MTRSCLQRIAVIGMIMCLTACQQKSAADPQTTGQEVARVGSEPITTSELQFELRSASQQPQSDRDKAIALQRIAARKSLAQKAIALGFDRQPTILLEIRKAREQILANAAASSDAKKEEQKISLEAVNAYVASHPLQFANRQLLNVDELLVPAKSDIDKIVPAIKSYTTLDQVEKYFSDNQIPFDKKQVELDTSTLPQQLAQALLEQNNIPVVRTPVASIFMKVKQSLPAAIVGENAGKIARSDIVRSFFEKELSAPSVGDDITYMPPYKDLIEKMQSSAKSAR